MSNVQESCRDLLQPLIAIEEKIQRLDAFCRMCDQLAGDNSPEWLFMLWGLVRDAESAIQPISHGLRNIAGTPSA